MVRVIVGLLAAHVLTYGAACLAEEKTITWVVVDVPPQSMFLTPYPGTLSELGDGSTDIATRAIAAQLPAYRHRVLGANFSRIIHEMQDGKPLCMPSAARTPTTEKIAYFTSRGITPPHHLIVLKKNLNRVTGGAKTVSLAKLLQNKALFGITVAERKFNPAIDALLAVPHSQLSTIPASRLANMLDMLNAGRMDYTLELPQIVEYYKQQSPQRNELIAVPIEESNKPNTVWIACTRSAWGAQAIRDIDKAVQAAIKGDDHIRTALLRWLPPYLQTEYEELFKEYFKQRLKEPPPVTD